LAVLRKNIDFELFGPNSITPFHLGQVDGSDFSVAAQPTALLQKWSAAIKTKGMLYFMRAEEFAAPVTGSGFSSSQKYRPTQSARRSIHWEKLRRQGVFSRVAARRSFHRQGEQAGEQ